MGAVLDELLRFAPWVPRLAIARIDVRAFSPLRRYPYNVERSPYGNRFGALPFSIAAEVVIR
jgi:hypothetical protein